MAAMRRVRMGCSLMIHESSGGGRRRGRMHSPSPRLLVSHWQVAKVEAPGWMPGLRDSGAPCGVLQAFFGQEFYQVDDPAGIAPLVVVPGHHLEQVAVQ